MSKELVEALKSVRTLIRLLPLFTREQVETLIQMELAGRRRRSIGMRLAQRAANLDASSTYHKVMKEFNDAP